MDHADSEPTKDGRVIVYYDKRWKVVAVEITDNNALKLGEPSRVSISSCFHAICLLLVWIMRLQVLW
ncbi:hypothetical protein COZ60_02065 [Candidatus Bathyarchaeota archaeon CG_4_8_14_3_um_filter_42_8]|nr:MAG: hypothetical protein COZ60_02065 [Candidatus Bathyarchaeota archaeon CG_4_8_14_3_um_filter_42_8]